MGFSDGFANFWRFLGLMCFFLGFWKANAWCSILAATALVTDPQERASWVPSQEAGKWMNTWICRNQKPRTKIFF